MSELSALAFDAKCDALERELKSDKHITQNLLDDALYRAIENDQVQAVRMLLAHGAQLKRVSFLSVCRHHSIPIFDALAEHGWDVNSLEFGGPALRYSPHDLETTKGWLTMRCAISRLVVEDDACVKWLLQRGANPNLRGVDQNNRPTGSILATAALTPTVASLRYLISYGAEADPAALFNTIDARGRSTPASTKFLIEAGIDVNARDAKSRTPLMNASAVGNVERVKYLLAAGADREAVTSAGQTAIDIAQERGRAEVVTLLKGIDGT